LTIYHELRAQEYAENGLVALIGGEIFSINIDQVVGFIAKSDNLHNKIILGFYHGWGVEMRQTLATDVW
jgi:hypothetical protein